MLFFQLMTRRYERASTVLTSNITAISSRSAATAIAWRQHTERWQTLHAARDPEPASRRRRRQEVATA